MYPFCFFFYLQSKRDALNISCEATWIGRAGIFHPHSREFSRLLPIQAAPYWNLKKYVALYIFNERLGLGSYLLFVGPI